MSVTQTHPNCLSSHIRNACAVSTCQTQLRKSVESQHLLLLFAFSQPATLCPALSTPMHLDAILNLFAYLSPLQTCLYLGTALMPEGRAHRFPGICAVSTKSSCAPHSSLRTVSTSSPSSTHTRMHTWSSQNLVTLFHAPLCAFAYSSMVTKPLALSAAAGCLKRDSSLTTFFQTFHFYPNLLPFVMCMMSFSAQIRLSLSPSGATYARMTIWSRAVSPTWQQSTAGFSLRHRLAVVRLNISSIVDQMRCHFQVHESSGHSL